VLGFGPRLNGAASSARRLCQTPKAVEPEGAAAFSVPNRNPGTDNQLLFVIGVFVLTDFKPARVCEPERSADSALPRSGNRQAPHE
jgi:hypothetical protein